MYTYRRSKGFTLIELLVVIAIIGIFSTLIIGNLNSARKRARDARRMADFRNLSTALDLYYDINSEIFPCGDAGSGSYMWDGSGSSGFLNGTHGSSVPNCVGTTGGLYTTGIISNPAPLDPVNSVGTSIYAYLVTANRKSYIMFTTFEDSTNLQKARNDGGVCDNYYEVGNAVGSIPIDPSWDSNFYLPCN
ncbi:MAG: type II secretion system protein [Candidatus Pacebacteria bacterium]|nr:type II secretion system protein [Candidatus Paceibacterota bacterium]